MLKRKRYNEPDKVVLPEIGKIKVGIKAVSEKSGKEYPKAIDYFRLDAIPTYCEYFKSRYGDKPAKLSILFPSNEIDEVCRHEYQLRDGSGKCSVKGDGITFHVATKDTSGQVVFNPVTPDDPDKWMYEQEKRTGTKFSEVLILKFVIPDFPVFGYFSFRTAADDSSIPAIVSHINQVNNIAGRISMIPFDMTVKMVKADKSGSASAYPVVNLVANLAPENLELIQSLPSGFTRIITAQVLAGNDVAKAIEAPQAEPKPYSIPEYAEYEDVRDDETIAREFLDNYDFRGEAELNEAVAGIKFSDMTRGQKSQAAMILKKIAEEMGAVYNAALYRYEVKSV